MAFDKIDNNFKTTLLLKKDSDRYDDQNKDQLDKINLYLKSLMQAFISINQKSNLYEIEQLPVKTTLKKLETWIKIYSLKLPENFLLKRSILLRNSM